MRGLVLIGFSRPVWCDLQGVSGGMGAGPLGPRVITVTSPGSSSSDGIRAGAFLNDVPPPERRVQTTANKGWWLVRVNPSPSSHCEVVDTIRFKG